MSHDETWLATLLQQWTVLTPEVRTLVQAYMNLSPGDRKNQRRLEKKLKTAACRAEACDYDPTPCKGTS